MTAAPEETRQARAKPSGTSDRDVREAVLRKILADHVADPTVLVVEELGLEHGSCRVDIAVINGFLHGYEIKSDIDNLLRLPRQVEAYSKALDRATLIVGEKHLSRAVAMLPAWWGVKVASVGTRGAVHIETHRQVANNPRVSVFHVAQLLWRPEAVGILRQMGVKKDLSKVNRYTLYGLLAETADPSQLRRHVREALKQRTKWRCP